MAPEFGKVENSDGSSAGIDRVVDGKITGGWGELDLLGMMQQIEAIPSPQSLAASEDSADSAKGEEA